MKLYAENKHSKLVFRSPLPQHWYDSSIGSSLCHLSWTVNSSKKEFAVELYTDNNKDLFHHIFQNKADIEQKIGQKLEWLELEGKNASRIKLYLEADFYNKNEWDKQLVFQSDPEQLVSYPNLSTIRLAYENPESDPYENLNSKDEFDFIIKNRNRFYDLGKGTVIAHWKLPFREIPTELICAQEFQNAKINTDFHNQMKMTLKRIYSRGERKFVSNNQLFHVILFAYPDNILSTLLDYGLIDESVASQEEMLGNIIYMDDCWEEIFQQENESSNSWINRRLESNYYKSTIPDILFTSKSYKLLKQQQSLRTR